MKKKIVLTVFVLLILSTTMLPRLVAQLTSGESISQNEEDFLDRYEPWAISGEWTLDWDLFPWHTVRFWDCSGFIIDGDNTELDLNGHTVMFNQTEVGPGPTGIEVKGKSGVIIKNGTIISFQYGIWVEDSDEVDIVLNNVSLSTRQGIGIRNSENVKLTFNNVSESGYVGIGIDKGSSNITIWSNDVSTSGDVGVGVYDDSFNVVINGNTVTANGREGVHLMDSNHNTVVNNDIMNCEYGIYLYNSNNTKIYDNTLSNNRAFAIYVDDAYQNIIYHNDFINNAKHVESVGSTNDWDAGYGTTDDIGFGGNYWDDYDGVDEFSGRNQNVGGSDGIGDTSYRLDGENQDDYPLMEPWYSMLVGFGVTWSTEVIEETLISQVVFFSNCSVAGYSFDKTEGAVRLTVSNGSFCKVIISREVLDGSFSVIVDNVPTACLINWDETHHFINFTFNNDPHEVRITGEIATRIIGDLNGDGAVDINDLFILSKNWGKELEE